MSNPIRDIEILKHQLQCFIKNSAILIVHINDNPPDQRLLNTLQVDNSGNKWIIDKVGEIEKITDAGSLTAKIPFLEVQIGSPEAIAAGIIAGSLTITNSYYANSNIEILIENVNLPSVDRGDGSTYFTHNYTSPTIIFAPVTPLINTVWIKIKVY